MKTMKMPHVKTKIWRLLEFWAASGDLRYIDLQDEWCRLEPRCGARHAGLAVTRVLKRFGMKMGPPKSHAPWRMHDHVKGDVISNPAYLKVIERDQPPLELYGGGASSMDRAAALVAIRDGAP